MLDKLKTLLLVIMCSVAVIYSFYLYNPTHLKIDDSSLYLLTNLSDNAYFAPYSENTGLIDLGGLSNIVLNMQKDGYEIQNMKATSNDMDIILQNDSEVYRLYFNKEMKIISIASPYSKSGVPFTYINEKKSIE